MSLGHLAVLGAGSLCLECGIGRRGDWYGGIGRCLLYQDFPRIDANISFNTSNERESCGGTFTGSITYQVPVQNDEGGFEAQDWTATEGTVSYTVS